jgi:hypothetical protein
MSLDRQAAKAAGYTDAEIDAYEAEQKQKGATATEMSGTEPPPPPPPSATQNQNTGVDYGELATTMGLAAAPYVLPAVGVGAAGYGALKVGGWGRNLAESARDISTAMRERTAVEAAREARMANRPGFGGPGPQPAPAAGPVAPATGVGTAPASASAASGQTAAAATRASVLPAMAAQSMLAAPYLGAAYEQARIRANPTAPEYQDNPYAMMTRGQAATQGQAGAMNTRSALANQQYGGLTANEQRMLEQDRINQAIRRKAAEKVLGPIAPSGY